MFDLKCICSITKQLVRHGMTVEPSLVDFLQAR